MILRLAMNNICIMHFVLGEWLCEFLDPDGNAFDLKQPLQPEKCTAQVVFVCRHH